MIRSVVELSFRPPRLLGWAPSVPSAALGGLRASEVSLTSLTPPVISMPPVSLAVLAPPTLAIPVISMPLMLLIILVPPVLPKPLVPLVPLVLLVLAPGLLIPALRLRITIGAFCESGPGVLVPPDILSPPHPQLWEGPKHDTLYPSEVWCAPFIRGLVLFIRGLALFIRDLALST